MLATTAGCGGDDEKKTAAEKPASTPTATATTATTPTTDTAPTPSATDGPGISIEDAKSAIEAEGIKTNDVKPANTFLTPLPEASFSLISPDTGTVSHGGVNEFKTAADAEAAKANLEKGGSKLDLVVAKNLLITQEKEPYEDFPSADEIAAIVQR